jgi:hypothetical protein
MSEDISKQLTTSKMIAFYSMIALLWFSWSIYKHGFTLTRATRLILFFALLPFKLWLIGILMFIHFNLTQQLFGEIFERAGTLDNTTRIVLNHWWVLLLMYFLTGNKSLVLFLSFGIFFILQGIQLRRSLLKPDNHTNTRGEPFPATLVFSILVILFIGTILMSFFTKEYSLGIRIAAFIGLVAMILQSFRQPETKKGKGSSNLQKPKPKNISIFPYRLRKKMWYDWLLTIIVVLVLMLSIIPISYMCAFIYMTKF